MARDLDQLKETLWTHFEAAIKRHPEYEDRSSSGSSTPFNPTIENRNAIANIANALVNIEAEQRAQRAEKIADEERKNGMKMPGK
ncbi:MAG: hypothetical protein IT560_13750 [Alphaproteobacteria bacterium]|nr:hypothetical protein [Alphaproteobacteria bacterium]